MTTQSTTETEREAFDKAFGEANHTAAMNGSDGVRAATLWEGWLARATLPTPGAPAVPPLPPTRRLASGVINGKQIELRGWHEEDLTAWHADLVSAGAPAAPQGQAEANYERIGYIHAGDKFIYPTRGKPTDKPVYIRVSPPKDPA
jgi:hypothetical protein